MTPESMALVKGLGSRKCRCGRVKLSGNSFCAVCYRRLPDHMRVILYRTIGAGYEEAYRAAVKMLEESGVEEDTQG